MEPDWIILIIVITLVVLLIGFLIYRNYTDKEDLTKKIIGEDELSVPKKPDSEVDTEE